MISTSDTPKEDVVTSYAQAPARTVTAGGVTYAYRELGPKGGIPVIFFVHLAANLDNWDPRVIDPIAKNHHVITFDNRGVGASSGQVPNTVEAMADDAYTFVKALGFSKIDIFSFSLGGFVAQALVVNRLKERTVDRDAPIKLKALQTQLKAIRKWGRGTPDDLSKLTQPTLIANGDNDRMVPSNLSEDLHQRIKGSELTIYPDSGHGGIFQYHDKFAPAAVEFLDRDDRDQSKAGVK